jgi:hypothetical protein
MYHTSTKPGTGECEVMKVLKVMKVMKAMKMAEVAEAVNNEIIEDGLQDGCDEGYEGNEGV